MYEGICLTPNPDYYVEIWNKTNQHFHWEQRNETTKWIEVEVFILKIVFFSRI